jgi:hypothetical protein
VERALKPVFQVLGCSLAVSALLFASMLIERAGVAHPYSLRAFPHLALYQDFYAFAPYLAILLLALYSPVGEIGIRIAGWCGEHPWPLAAATSLALAAGAVFVYARHPLSMDEYAAVFQSEIFASARLTGQIPPELIDWMLPTGKTVQGKFLRVDAQTGAIAAAYWPGFSLLLAPFTAIGVPWLLNPLIGGATVLAMHRIGMALFGSREGAGLVALLTVASPAVTVNALSFYAMPAHLLASALYLLLLLKPTVKRALAAGAVGSYALMLHSPVPHLFFALPWFVWLGLQPGGRKLLGALIAGYLPLCIVGGFGWPMFLDHMNLAGAAGAAVAPAGPVETVLRRLRFIADWIYDPGYGRHVLSFAKLWLWAAPALVTAAVFGAWQLRRERGAWMVIAASGLLSYVGYLAVPFDQGHGWGYRYFHQAWLVLPLFAVAGLRSTAPSALRGYLAGSAFLSLALLTTFHAMQVKTFIARHLQQLPALSANARVVIVNPSHGYYAWDLAQVDPFLRRPVTLLVSNGMPADHAMMAKVFPAYELLDADPRASVWGVK